MKIHRGDALARPLGVTIMAADWEAMRLEYAATDISLRELAKKYGVPMRTLARHSANENWQQQRQQHCERLATAVSEAIVAKQTMDYTEYIRLSEQATILGAKIFAGMREADLIRNPGLGRDLSSQLRDAGVALSLDEFGRGISDLLIMEIIGTTKYI